LSPSIKHSSSPTVVPSVSPTDSPSAKPSFLPSAIPSSTPSVKPSPILTSKLERDYSRVKIVVGSVAGSIVVLALLILFSFKYRQRLKRNEHNDRNQNFKKEIPLSHQTSTQVQNQFSEHNNFEPIKEKEKTTIERSKEDDLIQNNLLSGFFE